MFSVHIPLEALIPILRKEFNIDEEDICQLQVRTSGLGFVALTRAEYKMLDKESSIH